MSNTIQCIEEEIRKLEARLRQMEKEAASCEDEQKIQAATRRLLKDVISDLRQQQEKLRQGDASKPKHA